MGHENNDNRGNINPMNPIGTVGFIGLINPLPWEDIDRLVREQAEAEMWADMEHDEWLASLFADQSSESIPVSDPCFTEWWDNGAPSVAGQWTMLGRGDVAVLPEWDREDWVGV